MSVNATDGRASSPSRRRLLTGGALASAVVALPIATARAADGASSRGPRRPAVDVRTFGAVGDGAADDSAAIRAAVAALRRGGRLVFPPGRYLVHDYVDIEGKTDVTITGYGATIASSRQDQPVVVLYGNATIAFTGFGIRHTSTSGGRTGGGFGVKVASSTDVLVKDCRVQHTSSAGILTQASRRVRILRNTVHDTLSDGIHTTGGSAHVSIVGNTLNRTGDDAIAVVSYQADGRPCRHVFISGNSVSRSRGRGIDVVGGSNVMISGNVVDATRAAGLMVAQERNYATFGAQAITITGNTVRDAVTMTAGGAVGHGAVMVNCADPEFPISGVVISHNTVRGPRLWAFLVSGDPDGLQDVLLDSNVFIGPSTTDHRSGFDIAAADGVYVRNNLASHPSGDGFNVSATGTVVLTGNDVRSVRAGSLAYRVTESTMTSGNRSS